MLNPGFKLHNTRVQKIAFKDNKIENGRKTTQLMVITKGIQRCLIPIGLNLRGR